MVRSAGTALAAMAVIGVTAGAPGAIPAAAAQSAAAAGTSRAIASNGAVVDMPDIAALDCPGMERTLRRIDLSHYRGPGPVPAEHPDRPIFDYEDRLSSAYYFACTLERHRLDDPGPAFSFGFEPQ